MPLDRQATNGDPVPQQPNGDDLSLLPEIAQAPQTDSGRAIGYYAMASAAVIGSVVLFIAGQIIRNDPTISSAVLALGLAFAIALTFGTNAVAGLLAVWGLFLVRKGRRYSLPSLRQVLEDDKRRPVVLFRPFSLDGKPFGGTSSLLIQALGGPAHLPVFATMEDSLKPVAERVGPFVAIGSPVDSIAQLGAARVYASEERWRAVVEILLRHAAAAIVVVADYGVTDWTYWEYETAKRLLPPERVFLLHVAGRRWLQPNSKATRFVEELAFSTEILVHAARTPSVIRFDHAGTPQVVCRPRFLNQVDLDPMSDQLHAAFLASGLAPSCPPARNRPIVVVIVLGLALVLAFVWLIFLNRL